MNILTASQAAEITEKIRETPEYNKYLIRELEWAVDRISKDILETTKRGLYKTECYPFNNMEIHTDLDVLKELIREELVNLGYKAEFYEEQSDRGNTVTVIKIQWS